MLISCIILVLLAIMPVQSLAWYGGTFHPNGDAGDVHYEDTKKWAIELGMDKFWAVQTAAHCDSVDILFKKDLRWHLDRSQFTNDTEDTRILRSKNEMIIARRKIDEAASAKKAMEKSKSRWDRSKYCLKMNKAMEEAIMYLGRGLHPIQDLYAHMDAGKDKTDKEIGSSHGMLDANPVDVSVIYPDGTIEIRQMKLEEKDSNGFVYSLYDDVCYDYQDGWIFRVDGKKEDNQRWISTRDASKDLITGFLDYAESKGISF